MYRLAIALYASTVCFWRCVLDVFKYDFKAMINHKELCDEVCRLAAEVGTFLATERKNLNSVDTQSKGVHDYVTRFDKESERRIVERARKLLPDSDFIAEEGTAARTGNCRYTWIVDPLDGTTNFIHAFAPTCVSIGLQDNQLSAECGRPVMALGVVYEIWADECFCACQGVEGAYLNGHPIAVSKTPTVNDSLLATGLPYSDFGRMEQYICDAFYEYGLKPYDVAAGAFIVEKAGGRVGDFAGGHNWLFGGEMVAANPLVFDELTTQLQHFGL